MNPRKYKQNNNEAKIAFVTRIVTSENRPMTASEVFACIDTDAMPDVVARRIHANTSDAAGNYNLIAKKRMLNKEGLMRVHYFPLGMNVDGEDIPVPAYTKEGGNTFTNESADEEEEANECWKCGSIVAMEDTVVEGTKSFCSSCAIPAPVKVAEKVLADLGADDDDGLRTLLTNEPIPRDDDDLFSEPLILEVLAQYHMTTVGVVKKRISHHITTARTTEDNRALFDILKEMMS
jgi:hypothetical protein